MADACGLQKASAFLTLGKSVDSAIAGEDDGDSFLIKAPGGDRYLASLYTPDASQLGFALVDAHGTKLEKHFTNRGAPPLHGHATFKFTLPAASGPYFPKAIGTGASHSGRGHCTLGLARQ